MLRDKDMEKKIILVGAGKIGEEALRFYGADNVVAFCDNNSALHGSYVCEKRVMDINELSSCYESYRVIVAVGAAEAIWNISMQLKSLSIP